MYTEVAPWAVADKKVKLVRLALPALHSGQVPVIEDQHRIVIATAGSKWGKAVWVNEPVPTPTGHTTMGDLQVGDTVFDDQGNQTRVSWVSPVFVGDPCYRLAFSTGEEIIASADHLWRVQLCRPKNRLAGTREYALLTTRQMADSGAANKHGHYMFRVPLAGALRFTTDDVDSELPINPYLFGCWLGDGTSTYASFSTNDAEILQAWRDDGWPMYVGKGPYLYGICRKEDGNGKTNKFCDLMRGLGVLGNKHIPCVYMRSSVRQRIALLRGLMDTDGCCKKGKRSTAGTQIYSTEFTNMNETLADQVCDLVNELGGKAVKRTCRSIYLGKDCGPCYRISVRTPFNPFRLTRKAERYSVTNGMHRAIKSIEAVPSVPVRCIEVESPSHLFLIGRSGIPTHNTYGMSIWLLREAWNRYQSVNWWVAPVYRQSRIAYQLMRQMLPPHRFRKSDTDMTIELLRSNGEPHSLIEFRSADHPDTLRGSGVHAVVGDEAAYWARESYISVWTTLSRTLGKLRLISTPKGRNFFFEEWCKGQDPAFPEFASYQLPTWQNPHVPAESIDLLRRTLPSDAFRQNIGAEFLEDGAGVFTKIAAAQRATWIDKPKSGARYVMGIDFAKHQDFTVFCIGDLATREIVHLEHFTGVDWNIQIDRAIKKAKYWNDALVLMDSTGIGDVIYDAMRSVYPRTTAYQISNNQAKVALIQKLQLAFERGDIAIPEPSTENTSVKLSRVMQKELEVYGYNISAMGKFIFSAPVGYHDDMVVGLALCWWHLTEQPMNYKWRSVRGV